MPAILGRKVRIKRSTDGGTTWVTIAGARSDRITINRGGADVTDKDDNGLRTMLGDVATLSVEMQVEGVFNDKTFLTDGLDANTALYDFQIDLELIGTATGKWFLSNVELGAPHEDAATFSAQLMSSGPVYWTDAP